MLTAAIGSAFYFLNSKVGSSETKSRVNSNFCDKCQGNGHWRATRGEKVSCSKCNGTGWTEDEE